MPNRANEWYEMVNWQQGISGQRRKVRIPGRGCKVGVYGCCDRQRFSKVPNPELVLVQFTRMWNWSGFCTLFYPSVGLYPSPKMDYMDPEKGPTRCF